MEFHDYEQKFKLKSNEAPAKVNLETGEVKVLTKTCDTPGHRSDSHMIWQPAGQFSKSFSKSWIYLDKVLKPHEYKAAHKLAMKAKAFTNSLEPLNDETILSILVEEIGIGKNQVKPVLKRLFDLGGYGRFEVAEPNKPYTKYWILNPYLSFNGRVIEKSIAELFKGTIVAMAFRGEII